MAEGAGRLEADEAEDEAGVVVEEADVAESGEDLVTSIFFRKTVLLLWRVKKVFCACSWGRI